MKDLSESAFHKWRCLIALAHVDGHLHKNEEILLKAGMESLKGACSAAQYGILYSDFSKPRDPDEFFEKITDKFDQIDLLHMAYYLFWSDGEFDDSEKHYFYSFRSNICEQHNINEKELDKLVKMDMTPDHISMEDIIKNIVEKDSGDKNE